MFTNVSGNEIPPLPLSLTEGIRQQPAESLARYRIASERVTEYKVVPSLLLGDCFYAQFGALLEQAKLRGIRRTVRLQTKVVDAVDESVRPDGIGYEKLVCLIHVAADRVVVRNFRTSATSLSIGPSLGHGIESLPQLVAVGSHRARTVFRSHSQATKTVLRRS